MRMGPIPKPTETRFWAKVQGRGTDGCWRWVGFLNADGYGQFRGAGRSQMRAHRWAYEQLVGPIPTDLVLDHLCRNRSCVNPDHLEAVSNAENTRRSGMATNNPLHPEAGERTHCGRGHHLLDVGVYLVHRSDGYVRRRCRACSSANAAARYRVRKTSNAERP